MEHQKIQIIDNVRYLAHPFFLQFGVPLIAVGLSIFLKFVTRNDLHKSFRKEDMAVGLDLAVAALLLFITASSSLAKELVTNSTPELIAKSQSVPWILSAYLLGIWGVSTIVRKFGWERSEKLKTGWGIVLPGVFGLVVLFLTVSWITR